ncbi:SGNH/GDSL hydrolase family protein [bacterium]|nr:hypothetical protein [Gemmatimonadota bacterium]MCH2665237.1 SGNH/GDSL hydrolase family protein [bacterium]
MNRGINDHRDAQVKRIVVFGESHGVGIAASAEQMGWAEVLGDLIGTFQDGSIELINRSLGADVLSKACPLYEEYEGKRPIGIERYRKHIIEERPDLVILSYGYNDLRAGTPIKDFRQDLETILKDLKSETDALIVLLNTYAIPGEGYENKSGDTGSGNHWNHGNRETQTLYNLMLNDVSEEQGLLFVDIHGTQVRSPWTFSSPDGTGDLHANDLGHRLIAHRIFEALATTSSFLSLKPLKARAKGKSLWRHSTKSVEAKLIADFYPDSPEIAKYKKRPAKKGKS